jgi:hypothetical protein
MIVATSKLKMFFLANALDCFKTDPYASAQTHVNEEYVEPPGALRAYA